jgi:hypothetical protein
MGQAKRRGTFEERRAQAAIRNDAIARESRRVGIAPERPRVVLNAGGMHNRLVISSLLAALSAGMRR